MYTYTSVLPLTCKVHDRVSGGRNHRERNHVHTRNSLSVYNMTIPYPPEHADELGTAILFDYLPCL